MTAHEAGRQIGYAAVPVILLVAAAYAGWRMGRKRQPPTFVIWPVAVAAALLLAGFVGMQLKQARERSPYSESR
ncbi:MAG TPA: hypothetical protein VMG08_19805 [Allosphingosinicella sp.]|nr:hypothetical protein [Allosphingosinicella sp.]